jgi:hypothetical protein
MDKRVKKLLACTLSATMLIGSSTTVFASTISSTTTGSSDVTIENDNSKAPDYTAVQLPTTSSNQYDFTVDPEQLLSKYDPDNYAAGTSLYFQSETASAKLVVTGSAIYEKSLEVSTTDDLKSAIVGNSQQGSSSAVSAISGAAFYVWTPKDQGQTGQGEFTELDATNVTDYFTVELASDGATATSVTAPKGSASLSGAHPFDGKVYKAKYTEKAVGTELELADYGSYDASTKTYTPVTGAAVGLYAENDGTDTPAGVGGTSGLLEVVEAETGYTAKSDVITVVNKSSRPATVTAKVDVKNIDGLNFGDSVTLDDTDDLVMAISDDKTYEFIQTPEPASGAAVTSGAAVATTASATFTVNLDKAQADVLTYQGDTGDTQNNNNSHNYYQYEAPGAKYSSVSLYLIGMAQTTDNWATYLKNQSAAATVDVTYTISELTVSTETATVNWDRKSDLDIIVDTALVPSMAAGDFGVNYDGTIFTYTGVYNGDTSIATTGLGSLNGNTITIKSGMAQFLPAGSQIYIVGADKSIVSVITVN